MESAIVVALNNIVVIFNHVRLNLLNHVLALFRANLLAIQHLETLYLVGNHVRVVCERV